MEGLAQEGEGAVVDVGGDVDAADLGADAFPESRCAGSMPSRGVAVGRRLEGVPPRVTPKSPKRSPLKMVPESRSSSLERFNYSFHCFPKTTCYMGHVVEISQEPKVNFVQDKNPLGV